MGKRVLLTTLAVIWAAFSGRVAMATPAQEPLFLTSGVSPMVMFALSVDHQLFQKAFADYSDLNKDGVIDNTYTDSFDYYGYFDSGRCYQYDTGNNVFVPRDAADGTGSHHCSNAAGDGDWSGNFLNWATMTRIDVLRKVLYGGKRAVDSTTQTVLERALLPNDVHAFVKVFTPVTGDSLSNYVPSAYASAGTVSMCNSTPVSSGDSQAVDTASNHPKIRIASGAWGRWSSDEVFQCEWRGNGVSPGTSQNLFGTGTSSAPSVRVQTCVAGKEEDNCREYDSATVEKPTGLLQTHGEDGTLRFGLITGSYQKRDRGGVLRKAISKFAGNATASDDEVNLANGIFNTGVNGIVSTLNKVRINEWNYATHKYDDCNTFGISINEYLTSTSSTRKCSNWGNPISEIYLEAVRYLIGEGSATGTFDVATDSLGLPSDTWNDPMPSDEWCAPMNVLLLSSGDNSFDTDNLGTVPAVLGSIGSSTDAIGVAEGISGDVFIGEVGPRLTNPDSNICSAKTFTSLSQLRGLCPTTPTKQGGYAVAGLAYKAHTTDLRPSDRQNDPVTGRGQTINTYAVAMSKSLPEFVFNVGGNSVQFVPNAYAGPTTTLPPVVSTAWKASSLAGVTVEETVYDNTTTPPNLTYVRFLAHWEDSAWGNDYDMDAISRISICVGAECTNHDDDNSGSNDTNPGDGVLRVTTRIVHKFAGVSVKVGFVASGTTADGEYTTLRHENSNNFSASDFSNDNASREPTPTIYTFTPGSSPGMNLPTPMQYAAKYGAFRDSNDNDLPDVQAEWDEDGDGVADTFFHADDPSQLGPKLASYLATIATTSSSASVVANSVSLQTTTRIYQAQFDSEDWSGSVLSFPVDVTTGELEPPEWDVADRVALQNWSTGRSWLTSDGSGGVPFRWANLHATQQAFLNAPPGSVPPTSDTFGSDRLEYLRGNNHYEIAQGNTGAGTPAFRDRSTPLGDVVNSTPTVVGAPNFGYSDSLESVTYSSFKAANDDVACYESDGVTLRSMSALEREPILYFGGNDGALHGASACTGDERIAYVPTAVYPDLNRLTSPNYTHQYYVDGGPTVVDAFWSGAWHTALVGTLRGGGKGVFALDVTDSSPTAFAESNAANIVLWDINPASDLDNDTVLEYAELGYTFSQPAIVKAEHHGWVAIFGNGYDSASGNAIMYVARINDGQLLAAVDLSATGNGSGSHGSNNGLSTLSPIDKDGDGDVDIVYGGDLNGNLWRFESTPGVGFSRANTTLLYTAKNSAGDRQSITSRPAVGQHPTSALGRMVYFGTGKYFESVDQDPANAVQYNTMYGIWDRDGGATISTVETRDSATLQQQTIETQTILTEFFVFERDANGDLVLDSDGDPIPVLIDDTGSASDPDNWAKEEFDIRIVSSTPVTWTPDGTCATDSSCGWYLDLTETGEKMVATPILRGGRLIYVTTTPSVLPCEAGGSGWLMEVDPNTGGRLDFPVFDLNGDGVFDYTDNLETTSGGNTVYLPVSGKRSKVGILQPPAILAGVGGTGDGSYGGAEGKYASGSKEAKIEVTIENPGLLGAGRKSWVRVK